MKALSILNPWCGLIAAGEKLIENRSRRMINARDWGTPFALHASMTIDQPAWSRILEIAPELAPELANTKEKARWHQLSRHTGAIIGIATIVTHVTDVRQIAEYTSPEQARWFFGPIGYVLRDVQALKRPVPCKGALGFWNVPEDIRRQVAEQIEVIA